MAFDFYRIIMYTKQERSKARQAFWTKFGQYMRPVPNADGEEVNWVNYKTGRRGIYFRMDADEKAATVSVHIENRDELSQEYMQQFESLKSFFHETMQEVSEWERKDDSLIAKYSLEPVNIFNQDDWPALISFFKQKITRLDEFWSLVKESFP